MKNIKIVCSGGYLQLINRMQTADLNSLCRVMQATFSQLMSNLIQTFLIAILRLELNIKFN